MHNVSKHFSFMFFVGTKTSNNFNKKMADSRNYKRIGDYDKAECLVGQLDPGDLIEMNRAGGKFQHWGVAVENIDGKQIIIHVTGDVASGLGAVLRARDTIADIRVEDLLSAVGPDPCRVNNSVDEKYEPYPTGAQVVRRGLSKLGEHDYSIWVNNCEHWASWCRNGNMYSVQVEEKEAELEEMKSKPKAKLDELKSKVDKLKDKGPPPPPFKPPPKIKIPDKMLNDLPFLKKFQDLDVDE